MIKTFIVLSLVTFLCVVSKAEEVQDQESKEFKTWVKRGPTSSIDYSQAMPIIKHEVPNDVTVVLFSVEQATEQTTKKINLLQVEMGQSEMSTTEVYENIVNPAVLAAIRGSHFEKSGIHLLVLSQKDLNTYSARIKNQAEEESAGTVNIL